jgi:Fe-S-cluster containining protein
MGVDALFRAYEQLTARADAAFEQVARDYPDAVKCRRHCDDCCHAVFGLFLVEAAYLQTFFAGLPSDMKSETILRCARADQELARLQQRMQDPVKARENEEDPLASGRVRCPLLNEEKDCVLYPQRPVTCRIYGVPTQVQGKGRVCRFSGFQAGKTYPTFDLDAVYRDLYEFSKDLVDMEGGTDPERAGLLISVSKALTTPLETLIHEPLGSE